MTARLLFSWLVLSLAATTVQADIVFYESFGNHGSGNSSLDSYTGFDNGGVTFSSDGTGADVRDSSSSAGEYSGASGGANVFLSDNTESFSIMGIDTTGFTDLFLRFGANEAVGGITGMDDTMVDIEFTTDNGANWTALTFTAGDSNGWSSTLLDTPAGSLPSISNLGLRFVSTVPTVQDLRFDDITIEGIVAASIPEPTTFMMFGAALCGLGVRRKR